MEDGARFSHFQIKIDLTIATSIADVIQILLVVTKISSDIIWKLRKIIIGYGGKMNHRAPREIPL